MPTDFQKSPLFQLLKPPSLNPTLAVYPAPPITAPQHAASISVPIPGKIAENINSPLGSV